MYQIRNPSLSELVWRMLDRTAKRRACIVKHPPKYHLKFIPKFYVRKLNSG